MKIKILLFSLMFFNSNIFCQNAYLDSQMIDEFIVNNGEAYLEKIIHSGKWYEDDETITQNKQLLKEFKKFIDDPMGFNYENLDFKNVFKVLNSAFIIVYPSQSEEPDSSQGQIKSNNNSIKKTITALDSLFNSNSKNITELVPSGVSITTKIIDGTSKFLVDRTKKELTISFFEKFQKRLDSIYVFSINTGKDEKLDFEVPLTSVFSNTYLLLESKDYYDVPSMGKTWISAFKKDLKNLPNSVESILNKNTKFHNTEKGRFIISTFNLIDKLENDMHPIEIIEDLSVQYNQYSNYRGDRYLGLTNLISSNVYKLDDNNVKKWVDLNALQALSNNAKKYFVALILNKGIKSNLFKNIDIKTSTGGSNTLLDIVKYGGLNYERIFLLIKNVVVNINKTEKSLNEITQLVKDDDKKIIKYISYVNSVSRIIESSVESFYSLDENFKANYFNSDFYEKYLPISNSIIQFSSSLNNENYGESLLMAINFLNKIPNEVNNHGFKEFTNKLSYYGNFLVDIIDASKNENIEIKSIIDNYALPVSSYRIKRRSNHSWDLSAYPGLYLGYELSKSQSSNFGLTAPIGFSYSRKNSGNESGSSSSLFVSAIDIAAPFSYRFSNDKAEGLPENIKWEQVFAPGLFYAYGFKNSPLALSIGGQFTPLLRKIEENNILDDRNVFRIQLALTVDIPIFNFYKNDYSKNE